MATTPSGVAEAVAGTLAGMVKALDKVTQAELKAIAAPARKAMLAAAKPPTGGDRRYSRMSKWNHGGRLGVTTNTRRGLVFVGTKGPWAVAEFGTVPHRVNHPGTASSQGMRAWSLAAAPFTEKAATELPEKIFEAVEGAFNSGG